MFPFLQTSITSQMWPTGDKEERLNELMFLNFWVFTLINLSSGTTTSAGSRIYFLKQLKRSSVDLDDLYHFYTTVIRDVARSKNVGWTQMASAEREPITGVWGGAPSGVQGHSPWSGGQGGEAPLKLTAF